MANDHVKMFTEEYGPIAVQVSKQTGIAPSVLLAQWGMESGYGRSPVGTFNFGNIKDLSGGGKEGTDNQTGSKDKYLNFESPEAFGDYYSHFIRRLYPNALNAGTDISKYTEGLRNGVKGSYFEDPNYEDKVRGAHGLTTGFYKDPDEVPPVRLPTQAEQIKQERDAAGTTNEPPPTEPKELVDPLLAAGAGALTSGPGQVPFRPDYAAKPPDVGAIKEGYRNTIADLEASTNKSITSLEEAADKAQRRHEIAADRLQKRMSSPSPLAGGPTIAELEQEFKISQTALQSVDRELQARVAAQKAKVAPTPAPAAPNAPQAAPVATTAPLIITDPNQPSADQHTRAIQGTTVDDVTGRARQTTYNERTSQIARNAANQQQALQALGQQGIIDPKKAFALTEGISGATPSGVMVSPDLAGERQQQAELEQRMADDKVAQERLAQQQEMDRLKNERALAAQRQNQAQTAFAQAQRTQASGVARAQTAAETAEDRALAAKQDLESGRQTAQQNLNESGAKATAQHKADLKAARAAPGPFGRAMENTGVAVGRTSVFNPVGRTSIGALGGYEAATGANTLSQIPVAELLRRWAAGDRSPEVLQGLAAASGATAQTAAGLGAMTPAVGPKTAKVKGAGTIGTVGLGAYQAYKALQDEAAKAPQQ